MTEIVGILLAGSGMVLAFVTGRILGSFAGFTEGQRDGRSEGFAEAYEQGYEAAAKGDLPDLGEDEFADEDTKDCGCESCEVCEMCDPDPEGASDEDMIEVPITLTPPAK